MSAATLIGALAAERPTCGEVHVPATYNPRMALTWCICGDHQWHGQVPTLHARYVYDSPQPDATLVGFDCYWLPGEGADR